MSNIYIITGTSGSGKDSVVRALLQKDHNLFRVITHNSRPPREEEKEGVDYYFVSESEFESMIARNEFIEWARVYDQYKGISKAEIERGLHSHKDVLLRINIDGVTSIKKIYPHAISIFITAPDEEELEKRLKNRGTDNSEDQQIRLNEVSREHAFADQCDYIVINYTNQFENTVHQVESILQQNRQKAN